MSDETKKLVARFKRIFSGAQDRFVIHVPPFTTAESGKTTASWVGFARYGTQSFSDIPPGYEATDYVPCDTAQYKDHLNGVCGLALSPLLPVVKLSKEVKTNVCAYGVIDIDINDYNYTHLVQRLYMDGFQFVSFVSKSGGLHIYFIFSTYESAKDVREILQEIVLLYGLQKLFSKNKISKVEVFPDHVERKEGLKDKALLLPFFNSAEKSPNRLLTAEGKLVSLVKGLDIIETQLTSVQKIREVIKGLPYTDAPYCIQALLLSGALWDGSHRNDFLFTAALYLKQKHGKDAFTEDLLFEANERLAEPLEDKDVISAHRSVMQTDYPILGQCKKNPMIEWCDKKLCKEQTFSAIKKDKDNVASNIQFGQMWRVKTEQPYYLLEAKLVDSEEDGFEILRLDAAENLLNQRTVQRECIDKLGQVMWTVKQQVWEERLNAVMLDMQDKEVPEETDTTELSELRGLFNRYLTHGQVQSQNPFRISLKQVYFNNNKFYFQTEGLKDYLRIAKFNTQGRNLREYLLSYGCTEGSVEYERRDGTKGVIKCWVKEMDETLSEMTVYFEDVIDQDALLLEQNRLNKDDGAKDDDFVIEHETTKF